MQIFSIKQKIFSRKQQIFSRKEQVFSQNTKYCQENIKYCPKKEEILLTGGERGGNRFVQRRQSQAARGEARPMRREQC